MAESGLPLEAHTLEVREASVVTFPLPLATFCRPCTAPTQAGTADSACQQHTKFQAAGSGFQQLGSAIHSWHQRQSRAGYLWPLRICERPSSCSQLQMRMYTHRGAAEFTPGVHTRESLF